MTATLTREARIHEIIDAIQAFGGQMVDYSHEGGGMGGFVALGMLGDIKIDIEKLIEFELAAETARADREAAARQEAERRRDEVLFMLTETQGAAVDGQVSDFGLSFPVVRLIDDLRAERDRLRAELAALRG